MIKINDTCKYDEMVPLSDLQRNPLNAETYGDIKKDKEYLDNLKTILETQGLNSPVECVEGTRKILFGHHRTLVFGEAGNIEIPVSYISEPKTKT